MIKRIIKETVYEYDENGKMIKQTVTETTEDDDTIYYPSVPLNTPYTPPSWCRDGITCQYNTGTETKEN